MRELRLLGGVFRFTADDRRLLGLVDAAFGGLPPLSLARPAPRFHVQLRLQRGRKYRGEPPPARYSSGAGLLCATVDMASFAIVDAAGKRAFVSISDALLRSPYHARYELIEFAAMTLAARAQDLVPLHGACLVRRGHGILLLGASGAGKSTLCLQGLVDGLELLAEDSVFVEPATMRAVGLANFLHLRPQALRFVRTSQLAAVMRAAPTIRRRSGIRKREFDVRRSALRVAQRAPRIEAVVFVAARPGRDGAELVRLDAPTIAARLQSDQRYAAGQRGWSAFVAAARGRGFELRRGAHPEQAVELLHTLFERAAP